MHTVAAGFAYGACFVDIVIAVYSRWLLASWKATSFLGGASINYIKLPLALFWIFLILFVKPHVTQSCWYHSTAMQTWRDKKKSLSAEPTKHSKTQISVGDTWHPVLWQQPWNDKLSWQQHTVECKFFPIVGHVEGLHSTTPSHACSRHISGCHCH